MRNINPKTKYVFLILKSYAHIPDSSISIRRPWKGQSRSNQKQTWDDVKWPSKVNSRSSQAWCKQNQSKLN